LSASSARGALAELAPLWWAVRGYVAIAFVGVAGAGWSISHPAVPRLVNGKLGLLAIVLAAAFSLWAGRRLRAASGRARLVAVGANLVLLAAAVPVAGHLIHHSEPATILAVYSPPAFQEGG